MTKQLQNDKVITTSEVALWNDMVQPAGRLRKVEHHIAPGFVCQCIASSAQGPESV